MRSFYSMNKNQVRAPELSNDQIIQYAPSVGATRPHHKVSEKYLFISSLQVINLLRDEGWHPVSARESKTVLKDKSGFQKHIVTFQRENLWISSEEKVELHLTNSHDRSSAYNIFMGIFRLICKNGLMVGTKGLTYSVKHIGFSPDMIAAGSKAIAEHSSAVAEQIGTMRKIELSPKEQLAYATAAHSIRFPNPKKAVIQPAQLLEARRRTDNSSSLWSTFNKVQENVIKGGIIGYKKGKSRKTREIKSVGKDIKLNKALWVLAEKMREIKTEQYTDYGDEK